MRDGTPRANRFWGRLLVEELLRCGVDFFCVAPGSRSTPLVAAIAEHPEARTLVHYDERGTAFCALGYARATGRPAAWVTTSGTAVANGLPAVVEAATDCVPMLLLTADRPPELRQTGANQTIEQPGIFGGYVRWSFDVPPPDPVPDPAAVLTTVDQAVYRARRFPAGPVHLNLMFREPFLPEPGAPSPEIPPELRERDAPHTRYARTSPTPDAADLEELSSALRGVERGVIVAGRLRSRKQGEAAARLAEASGWPLLPDVCSQVRLGNRTGAAAPYYDLLLAGERFAEEHAPEVVIRVGDVPVSKRLQRFLTGSRPAAYVVVAEHPFRSDPDHRVTHRLEADVAELCAALVGRVGRSRSGWSGEWRRASEEAGRRLDGALRGREELSEPAVARLLSRLVPEEHALVVASSMPVRDLDTFADPEGAPVPVAANRGASGIDGTVATAAGFSHGAGRPVTLIVGDLALLHDLNSLAMLRDLSAVVVVLNNDGGGIFHFLPVAEHGGIFEPYFGTPHGLGFRPAAQMFGFGYSRPRTLEELAGAYRRACAEGGPHLVEVVADRRKNLELHRELVRRVSE
ncbi:2-succinyl-5-enolpyruvyl-6-hydroxy-3-cyclohexene- 1-carboxylate synthase [Rubrobacter xylanophilus]|uniref:2-succinyl-5-enolpyruvyl-6-hydroxy-3-cyclohexene-1-carboxylate synthase n=1 Tax=Rubrobacter xylanophilus TaxID=49319 RepID=A0A510HJK4_9ACTN|nr:2-succinyl-5-enolpyruvyl-6-hydroxy-3-cyclohexene-1-carboxylic-acid synthase [Rubrobacter xylanophilus]BBL80189.1 2-succinyl-5-enolpyruvyl-6-hydroxy-3-cyclohexene- 1-carboxylate synthase [Rubrobacter xylanophilus]